MHCCWSDCVFADLLASLGLQHLHALSTNMVCIGCGVPKDLMTAERRSRGVALCAAASAVSPPAPHCRRCAHYQGFLQAFGQSMAAQQETEVPPGYGCYETMIILRPDMTEEERYAHYSI